MENTKIEQAVLEQTERTLNKKLDEPETDQILQWHRGMSLREITNLPGWSIVKAISEDIIEDAQTDFTKTIDIDPSKFSDHDLKEKQAVAFGVKRGLTVLLTAIENAVEASHTPPEIVRQAAKNLKNSPETGQN